jgi:hypothetical protein
VPPNISPPDSLLPCFFDIEPIRRIVLAVDMAKLAVRGDVASAVRGDVVDEGGGVSDDEERLPTTPRGLEMGGPWSLNPLQPSACQPRLIPVLGAGKADTGRIFFLRGVVCS